MRASGFYHAALSQNCDAVRNVRDNTKVVGDQHNGHARLFLTFLDQVEDQGLCGDIERCCRLIRNQNSGAADCCHRNHCPLAHPARQLERIGIVGAVWIGEANFFEGLNTAVARCSFVLLAVEQQPFFDLCADGVEGRKGTHRFLKDHPNLAAT